VGTGSGPSAQPCLPLVLLPVAAHHAAKLSPGSALGNGPASIQTLRVGGAYSCWMLTAAHLGVFYNADSTASYDSLENMEHWVVAWHFWGGRTGHAG
jgi:hypothetical protein